MSLHNYENPNILYVPVGNITSDTLFPLFPAGTKKLIIQKVSILDPTGIAAHADNYAKIQLKSGSDLLAEHSTKDDAEGALVAGVWKELPETDVEAEGGDIGLNIDVEGTGATNAGFVAAIQWNYL